MRAVIGEMEQEIRDAPRRSMKIPLVLLLSTQIPIRLQRSFGCPKPLNLSPFEVLNTYFFLDITSELNDTFSRSV